MKIYVVVMCLISFVFLSTFCHAGSISLSHQLSFEGESQASIEIQNADDMEKYNYLKTEILITQENIQIGEAQSAILGKQLWSIAMIALLISAVVVVAGG